MQFLKRLLAPAKELSLSFVLLELIHSGLSSGTAQLLTSPVARDEASQFLYNLLPTKWKTPIGPMTEAEFQALLLEGIGFYQSIQSLLKK